MRSLNDVAVKDLMRQLGFPAFAEKGLDAADFHEVSATTAAGILRSAWDAGYTAACLDIAGVAQAQAEKS